MEGGFNNSNEVSTGVDVLQPAEDEKYRSMFTKVDTAKCSNGLSSEIAMPFFQKSGLSTLTIKSIVALVTNTTSQPIEWISQDHFVMIMHLIICMTKRGLKSLPSTLPPSCFPTVAMVPSSSSTMSSLSKSTSNNIVNVLQQCIQKGQLKSEQSTIDTVSRVLSILHSQESSIQSQFAEWCGGSSIESDSSALVQNYITKTLQDIQQLKQGNSSNDDLQVALNDLENARAKTKQLEEKRLEMQQQAIAASNEKVEELKKKLVFAESEIKQEDPVKPDFDAFGSPPLSASHSVPSLPPVVPSSTTTENDNTMLKKTMSLPSPSESNAQGNIDNSEVSFDSAFKTSPVVDAFDPFDSTETTTNTVTKISDDNNDDDMFAFDSTEANTVKKKSSGDNKDDAFDPFDSTADTTNTVTKNSDDNKDDMFAFDSTADTTTIKKNDDDSGMLGLETNDAAFDPFSSSQVELPKASPTAFENVAIAAVPSSEVNQEKKTAEDDFSFDAFGTSESSAPTTTSITAVPEIPVDGGFADFPSPQGVKSDASFPASDPFASFNSTKEDTVANSTKNTDADDNGFDASFADFSNATSPLPAPATTTTDSFAAFDDAANDDDFANFS